MDEIDKRAMGLRIKQIRLQAGMRQWELARLLGTTQSAVHKYEHGVVPEPRRLLSFRDARTSYNGYDDTKRPILPMGWH